MTILHITEEKDTLSHEGQHIKVIKANGDIRLFPSNKLKAIFLYAGVELNVKTILFSADNNIELIFCRKEGFPVQGSYGIRYDSHALSVSKQLKLSMQPMAKELAADWIQFGFERRLNLLEPYLNHPKIAAFCDRCRYVFENRLDASDIFHHEAWLVKEYYRVLSHCLQKGLKFQRRTRMPAKDVSNAILNYLYALLYVHLERIIIRTGLDPYIGFHHGMSRKNKAFLFDITDMYRYSCEEIVLTYQDEIMDLIHSDDLEKEVRLQIELRKFLIKKWYEHLYNGKGKNSLIKQMELELRKIQKLIVKAVN